MPSKATLFFLVLCSMLPAAGGLLLGCGQVKVTTAPEGALNIACTKGMKDCITRAQKTCGDKGYTILEGTSRAKLLGGSSSPYRKLSETAELTVVCGVEDEGKPHDIMFKLPKRRDEPPVEQPSSLPPQHSTTRLCIPGSTERCIGPGACEGGQVCLPDGSGYGPCDCGGAKSPPSEERSVTPDSTEEAQDPEIPGATPKPVPLN